MRRPSQDITQVKAWISTELWAQAKPYLESARTPGKVRKGALRRIIERALREFVETQEDLAPMGEKEF